MVFDDYHSGVPVAWVITDSGIQEEVATWLTALKDRLNCGQHEWKPSYFLVGDSTAEHNAIDLSH